MIGIIYIFVCFFFDCFNDGVEVVEINSEYVIVVSGYLVKLSDIVVMFYIDWEYFNICMFESVCGF